MGESQKFSLNGIVRDSNPCVSITSQNIMVENLSKNYRKGNSEIFICLLPAIISLRTISTWCKTRAKIIERAIVKSFCVCYQHSCYGGQFLHGANDPNQTWAQKDQFWYLCLWTNPTQPSRDDTFVCLLLSTQKKTENFHPWGQGISARKGIFRILQ